MSEELAASSPFGKWLKTQRIKKKLSIRQLIKKAGYPCSHVYVSQIEKNAYVSKKGKPMRPCEDIVASLAKALGADVNEALELAGYATKTASTVPEEILSVGFEELTPKQIKEIAEFMHSKLKKGRQYEQDRQYNQCSVFFCSDN
jgi:transcriptional regulator with XRE-family HTH domain